MLAYTSGLRYEVTLMPEIGRKRFHGSASLQSDSGAARIKNLAIPRMSH